MPQWGHTGWWGKPELASTIDTMSFDCGKRDVNYNAFFVKPSNTVEHKFIKLNLKSGLNYQHRTLGYKVNIIIRFSFFYLHKNVKASFSNEVYSR